MFGYKFSYVYFHIYFIFPISSTIVVHNSHNFCDVLNIMCKIAKLVLVFFLTLLAVGLLSFHNELYTC